MNKPNFRLDKIDDEAIGNSAKILKGVSLQKSGNNPEEKTFCSCFFYTEPCKYDSCVCEGEVANHDGGYCRCELVCRTNPEPCNCEGHVNPPEPPPRPCACNYECECNPEELRRKCRCVSL